MLTGSEKTNWRRYFVKVLMSITIVSLYNYIQFRKKKIQCAGDPHFHKKQIRASWVHRWMCGAFEMMWVHFIHNFSVVQKTSVQIKKLEKNENKICWKSKKSKNYIFFWTKCTDGLKDARMVKQSHKIELFFCDVPIL